MICCPYCGRDVPLIARKLGPFTTQNYILYYRCTQCKITFRKIHQGDSVPLTAVSYELVLNLPDGAEILSASRKLLGGA